MRILRVKVRKIRSATSCRFFYPAAWVTSKIHVLAWGPGKGIGEQIEECLCVTDDAVAEKLITSDEAVEINKAQANQLGREWRPVATIVTDEKGIVQIAKKLLDRKDDLRAFLTAGEIDALDEKKDTPGIRKGKQFDINDFS